MEFKTPLARGRLARRYKRFLADIDLESGGRVTAHCANPGAMTGLDAPGSAVWVEPVDDPKRKLRYSWRLVELGGGGFAGIDTGIPNRIVGEALRSRLVGPFSAYGSVRPEVRYGEASRVDFLLQEHGLPDLYLEVKNVHLSREPGWAEFPDCVTARGARHLSELAKMAAAGHRAAILYCIQYDGCSGLRIAGDIDPGYLAASELAREAGVEAHAFAAVLSTRGVSLGGGIPIGPPVRG